MENQEIMVAFAQAIQQVTAKVSALETTVQCLIAAQPAEQREQFGAALRQAASGLLAESDQRPLTGSALSHLKLAIDAYLEAAGQHPCNRTKRLAVAHCAPVSRHTAAMTRRCSAASVSIFARLSAISPVSPACLATR